MRSFTHLHRHAPEELQALIDLARRLKKSPRLDKPLDGKSLAFCFMNPSLRTQVSFETATASLGGHPVTVGLGTDTWKMESAEGVVMDGPAAEHLKEAVPVLSRFCSVLGLRSFPAGASWEEDKKEPHLSAFLKYATVPVVNLESATGHPCQALADLMTIRERMDPKGKNFLLTWAPQVKAVPMAVPNSAAEIAALAGMSVTIARPEGWDLDPEMMARVRAHCERNGAELKVTDRAAEGYDGAHVVYAKSWGAISRYGQPPPQDPAFRSRWIVDPAKMARTADAVFMHCLPVRRNVIVADAVIDSKASIVVDQAENRLHTAKAILLWLLEMESF